MFAWPLLIFSLCVLFSNIFRFLHRFCTYFLRVPRSIIFHLLRCSCRYVFCSCPFAISYRCLRSPDRACICTCTFPFFAGVLACFFSACAFFYCCQCLCGLCCHVSPRVLCSCFPVPAWPLLFSLCHYFAMIAWRLLVFLCACPCLLLSSVCVASAVMFSVRAFFRDFPMPAWPQLSPQQTKRPRHAPGGRTQRRGCAPRRDSQRWGSVSRGGAQLRGSFGEHGGVALFLAGNIASGLNFRGGETQRRVCASLQSGGALFVAEVHSGGAIFPLDYIVAVLCFQRETQRRDCVPCRRTQRRCSPQEQSGGAMFPLGYVAAGLCSPAGKHSGGTVCPAGVNSGGAQFPRREYTAAVLSASRKNTAAGLCSRWIS